MRARGVDRAVPYAPRRRRAAGARPQARVRGAAPDPGSGRERRARRQSTARSSDSGHRALAHPRSRRCAPTPVHPRRHRSRSARARVATGTRAQLAPPGLAWIVSPTGSTTSPSNAAGGAVAGSQPRLPMPPPPRGGGSRSTTRAQPRISTPPPSRTSRRTQLPSRPTSVRLVQLPTPPSVIVVALASARVRSSRRPARGAHVTPVAVGRSVASALSQSEGGACGGPSSSASQRTGTPLHQTLSSRGAPETRRTPSRAPGCTAVTEGMKIARSIARLSDVRHATLATPTSARGRLTSARASAASIESCACSSPTVMGRPSASTRTAGTSRSSLVRTHVCAHTRAEPMHERPAIASSESVQLRAARSKGYVTVQPCT